MSSICHQTLPSQYIIVAEIATIMLVEDKLYFPSGHCDLCQGYSRSDSQTEASANETVNKKTFEIPSAALIIG